LRTKTLRDASSALHGFSDEALEHHPNSRPSGIWSHFDRKPKRELFPVEWNTSLTVSVAILCRYSRMGASSRLRMYQYVPWLERAGLQVSVHPFWDDNYLEKRYAGHNTKLDWPTALRRRALKLSGAKKAQAIWLQGEAFPWMPWIFERYYWPSDTPIIVDYDDAIFHRYDMHKSRVARLAMGPKIDRVMRASTIVTAGNEYIAKRARAAGAVDVELVPTVIDLDHYQVAGKDLGSDRLRLGWIGSPTTWKEFGQDIVETARAVMPKYDARLLVVGARLDPAEQDGLEFQPWSEANEVQLIQKMDIGIMPLSDTAWARGKCGYKLIQYMACGVPVVASPVGVNSKIVTHGVDGFLAANSEEWIWALNTLLADADLRKRMGDAGRAKIKKEYSIQVQGPRMADLILRAGQ